MTNDDILKLAEEIRLTDSALGLGVTDYGDATNEIIAFAERIAAHECEQCAVLVVELLGGKPDSPFGKKLIERIKAPKD